MQKYLLLTALSAVLLAGCGLTSVSPDNRDASGRFNGLWRGQLQLTQEYQSYGHWEFFCNKFVTGIEVNINDGYADTRILNGKETDIRFRTAVDASGRLFEKVVIPNEVTIEFSGRFDASAGTGDATFKSGKNTSGFPYGCKAQWRVLRRNS